MKTQHVEKRPRKNPNAVEIPDERRDIRRLIIDLDHFEKPPGITSGAPLRD